MHSTVGWREQAAIADTRSVKANEKTASPLSMHRVIFSRSRTAQSSSGGPDQPPGGSLAGNDSSPHSSTSSESVDSFVDPDDSVPDSSFDITSTLTARDERFVAGRARIPSCPDPSGKTSVFVTLIAGTFPSYSVGSRPLTCVNGGENRRRTSPPWMTGTGRASTGPIRPGTL
jgi:hypothetical protein